MAVGPQNHVIPIHIHWIWGSNLFWGTAFANIPRTAQTPMPQILPWTPRLAEPLLHAWHWTNSETVEMVIDDGEWLSINATDGDWWWYNLMVCSWWLVESNSLGMVDGWMMVVDGYSPPNHSFWLLMGDYHASPSSMAESRCVQLSSTQAAHLVIMPLHSNKNL